VVTGIRASLRQSRDIKKNAIGVVDAKVIPNGYSCGHVVTLL
jgi:hypothetical protein